MCRDVREVNLVVKREHAEETSLEYEDVQRVGRSVGQTNVSWHRLHCGLTWPQSILALCYVETDKLLNAFLILLLGGTADWVLTWLSERSLWLPHLLVHPGQTQPAGPKKDKHKAKRSGVLKKLIDAGEEEKKTCKDSTVCKCINIQCDYICVGLLNSYTQRILAVLVPVVLCGSSLEE